MRGGGGILTQSFQVGDSTWTGGRNGGLHPQQVEGVSGGTGHIDKEGRAKEEEEGEEEEEEEGTESTLTQQE